MLCRELRRDTLVLELESFRFASCHGTSSTTLRITRKRIKQLSYAPSDPSTRDPPNSSRVPRIVRIPREYPEYFDHLASAPNISRTPNIWENISEYFTNIPHCLSIL